MGYYLEDADEEAEVRAGAKLILLESLVWPAVMLGLLAMLVWCWIGVP